MNNKEINTYFDEQDREYYHNTFTLDVELTPNDAIAALRFMETEVLAYNNIVNYLSAQFIRDHTFYLDLPMDATFIFSQMCMFGTNIYNPKKTDSFPKSLEYHRESIKGISNNAKFLFSEIATRMPGILPDIKRRMAFSILNFYIEQSKIRSKNSITGEEDEIRYTAAYDNLTPQTTFNKKHLQISRKDCIINKNDDYCLLEIPYLKKPIKIKTENKAIYVANWNYLMLKQKDAISTSKSQWIINFKRFEKNFYLYKYLDRQGKSGMFEMGKRRY